MRVYDHTPDGGQRESNSKRLKFSVDSSGNIIETYEDVSEYSMIVAGNVEEWYRDLAEKAKLRVRNNLASPLEYFMYRAEMEPDILAAMTGFTRRQVKRHLKPGAIESMHDATLRKYAEVLQVDREEIVNFRRGI